MGFVVVLFVMRQRNSEVKKMALKLHRAEKMLPKE